MLTVVDAILTEDSPSISARITVPGKLIDGRNAAVSLKVRADSASPERRLLGPNFSVSWADAR